uniref:Uncharacterized protein n=1 Tax=Daphnia galeata TaxID=27404 RepID=A0A8J2WEQ8_9CRUS|nr:unnamed protein product [Daphnia galeata]
MDLTTYLLYDYFALVIPIPDETANIRHRCLHSGKFESRNLTFASKIVSSRKSTWLELFFSIPSNFDSNDKICNSKHKHKNDTTVLLTKLANKLDSISNSRCINISDCVYQVKPGSRNVYMKRSLFAKDQIRTDFKRTGKCNLQFAKEGFFNYYVTFALPKNSPYTQSINQGLLKLQETGIIDYWDLWFRPMPPQCNGKPPSGNKGPQKKSSLSFRNLIGAFIVIGVGLSLSILVFLCEQIVFMRELHQRRASTNRKNYAISS